MVLSVEVRFTFFLYIIAIIFSVIIIYHNYFYFGKNLHDLEIKKSKPKLGTKLFFAYFSEKSIHQVFPIAFYERGLWILLSTVLFRFLIFGQNGQK